MSKRLFTSEFIKKAQSIHGVKYDYSRVEYKNTDTNICIICHQHGEFFQTPHNHINGSGCPYCVNKVKYNKNNFITRFNIIHNNKYDYSKSEFIDMKTNICIICSEHGEFWQKPKMHASGNGCPSCGIIKRTNSLKSNTDDFIVKSNMVHDNKYDYSKTNYISVNKPVIIICPEHGEFWQKPSVHLTGSGCQICGKSIKKTTDNFIVEARKVHNNKYDYSKAEYTGAYDNVIIICPEHGEFLQGARYHLSGQGCPVCNLSKGENKVSDFLIKNNIIHFKQYRFNDCRNKNPLPFDFYLPNHNICIEYDGIQHFREDSKWYSEDLIKNDKIKTKYCKDNNIKLIRISYLDFNEIENILLRELNKIKNKEN